MLRACPCAARLRLNSPDRVHKQSASSLLAASFLETTKTLTLMEEQREGVAPALTNEEKGLQVARFERFIEERLKVDLQKIANAQEKLQTQLGTLYVT